MMKMSDVMEQSESLKKLLLSAPDEQLDGSLKFLIEEWHTPPKALEVLEVLDKMVRYSLGSGFAVNTLELLLHAAIAREHTSYENLVEKATWRNDPI